ncbi:MAG: 4Fe-4S dicluster domain-containing protein [Gammaproteobacteria bacterium]|nr:4Fe-4S dicluster domain-containing protein [Gammaproteobacteria bacterium]
MQTNFTAEQLKDADVAASEQILRKCVHCGFCTATCPTYVLLGDELDSPRGRIYLIKDMLEHGRPATEEVVRHVDRCLSCLACMTTCPSGVHYQHLIDHARVHVEKTYRRPWRERIARSALAAVLPYPARFAAALTLGRLLAPAAGVLPASFRRLLRLLPPADRTAPAARRVPPAEKNAPAGHAPPAEQSPGAAPAEQSPGAAPAEQSPRAAPAARPAWSEPAVRKDAAPRSGPLRVALLDGCVQSVLAPRINAAAERLLRRAGADVVRVPGCCGAIVHHLGRDDRNRSLAQPLISRLARGIGAGDVDAIAVTASGCGTHAKDYGFIFRTDPELAGDAAVVSDRVRDIAELLDELDLPAPAEPPGGTVAYHSACSMQHGQRVERQPRELLARAGFEVAEIGEGHLCCGSAGTYNLLQPRIAEALRERKLAHVARTGAGIVATGNIGCMTQLASASDVPIAHTVELIDWAHGGPPPAGLGARASGGADPVSADGRFRGR